MLDFNHIPSTYAPRSSANRPKLDKDEIRLALMAKLPLLALDLFPAGKCRHNKYLVGDVTGQPGDSLELILAGPKAGLWTDRATGEGGDILALIALRSGLDMRTEFPQVLEKAKEWLGHSTFIPPSVMARRAATARTPAFDALGPVTARWDYQDACGNLIAVVKRYDPPHGRKQFRPWDVLQRRMAPPEPRPLYNQPGMLRSECVILVEGEKCAQALIQAGYCATTAMQGANAPVEKTDWSPLVGKHVLIWPDRDKPGWDYAQRAMQAILNAGAKSCEILVPPENKPPGWDAADALSDGTDVKAFAHKYFNAMPLGVSSSEGGTRNGAHHE